MLKNEEINKAIDTHIQHLNSKRSNFVFEVNNLSKLIIKKIKSGGKILLMGNGGSASDAQHIATELTVRLKHNRKGLPAISLATDTSALTAIGNDFDFNQIFSRQIEAIGTTKDLIILISTSGNSKNIITAAKFCKKNQIITYGVLGNKGGSVKKLCNNYFIAPTSDASRAQELHIMFLQLVCESVEKYFYNLFKK